MLFSGIGRSTIYVGGTDERHKVEIFLDFKEARF